MSSDSKKAKSAAALQMEGYRAYGAGEGLESNPYPPGFDSEMWIAGWAWARTDQKEANRQKGQR